MAASVGLNFDKTVTAIGRPELVYDERFNTGELKGDNMAEYIKLVRAWASEQTIEQASAVFDEYDIPYGKVNSSSEVVNSQIVQNRQMKVDMTLPGEIQTSVINTPFNFASGKSMPKGPPPKLGEHNEIVLRDLLGMSAEVRQSLYDDGIIVSDSTEIRNA